MCFGRDCDPAGGIKRVFVHLFPVSHNIYTDLNHRFSGPNAGSKQSFDILANLLRLGVAGRTGGRSIAVRWDEPGHRVDHRNIVGLHARNSCSNQMSQRLGLRAAQCAGCGDDGDAGGWVALVLKQLCRGLGNVNPRRFDLGHCQNGPGQFALFGAPIGRVKHLRCRAKARERIKQFVASAAGGRQALTRKDHAQVVALRFVDINRGTAHFVDGRLRVQCCDDFAGSGTFKTGI